MKQINNRQKTVVRPAENIQKHLIEARKLKRGIRMKKKPAVKAEKNERS